MPKRVSGKWYAQAVFQIALQRDQVDPWAEELQLVDRVLRDEQLRAFLKHARVPTSERVRVVQTVLQEVHPLIRNLVALLVTRGLVDLFHEVQVGYTRLLDQHRGREHAEVISAVPLDDRELERITRFVSDLIHKEVVVSSQVDESILGGVIIQVGDQLLDGSTRARLEGLRERIRSDVVIPAD